MPPLMRNLTGRPARVICVALFYAGWAVWDWVHHLPPDWIGSICGVAIVVLIFELPDLRSSYRRRKHQKLLETQPCPTCGYSLTGNSSGVCPECGKRFIWVATSTSPPR
jgi:endogenous inhibitor of DNA gyrase (YacG/DUF329 family)